MTPKAKPSAYAKRWWTTDLTQLRRIHTYWRSRARTERRAGRRVLELEETAKAAAKQYHNAIRQQKKSHWDAFLKDKTTSGKQQNTWTRASARPLAKCLNSYGQTNLGRPLIRNKLQSCWPPSFRLSLTTLKIRAINPNDLRYPCRTSPWRK